MFDNFSPRSSTIFVQIRKLGERVWNRHMDVNGNENQKEFRFSPGVRQSYAVSGPLLLTIGVGAVMGYSAVLLPQLQEPRQNNNTDGDGNSLGFNSSIGRVFTVDQNEASWIASMAALPMAIGTLISGYFIEKFGRKETHIIACLPSVIGWIMIFFSKGVRMLIAGRTLTGLCAGVLASATGVYIGEVSEPKYRGILLGGISLAVAGGLLLVHIIGTFLSWQATALFNLFIPITSIVLLYFTPESPSWLAKKGRIEEAKKCFEWFRGTEVSAKNELEDMVLRQIKKKEKQLEETHNQSFDVKALLVPEFLKPLAITVVFFIICQWSGPNAITFYSVSIMKDTIGEGLNEYLSMILIDLIRVIFSVVACICIRQYGRRPLAIVSGIGTSLSLFVLSAHGYVVKDDKSSASQFYFVPVVALITYIIFISIGYVSLPWAMIGEILPLANRSLGSSISAFMAFAATFSVVKTAPEMFSELGNGGTFLCYGVVALLGIIFVFLCLPETKEKTLQEIENEFRGRKSEITRNV